MIGALLAALVAIFIWNVTLRKMAEAGVQVSVIGQIREAEEGIRMIRRIRTCGAEGMGRVSVAIDPPYADESYKVAGRQPVELKR